MATFSIPVTPDGKLQAELVSGQLVPQCCCCELLVDFCYTNDGLEYTFTSHLTNVNGTPVYAWDFGDEGTSTDANPVHTYAEVGSYTVTLCVTDDVCERCKSIVLSREFDDCDELMICTEGMYAIVTLEFEDGLCEGHGEAVQWSALSGTYTYRGTGGTLGGWEALITSAEWTKKWRQTGIGDTHGSLDLTAILPPVFTTQCVEGDLVFGLGEALTELPGLTAIDMWEASGEETLPIVLPGTFTMTPGTTDHSLDALVTASVQFLGRPCPVNPCETPPTAGFTLTPLGGCRYLVTSTATANCDFECYYSNGHVGCEPFEWNAGSGCGENEAELTQIVIDTNGCSDEHTESVECCSCLDADGEPCPAGTCGECEQVVTLTATLTSGEGVYPCVYRLQASGTLEEGCGFVSYRLENGDCDADLANTDCAELDTSGACLGTLGPGQFTDVEISETTTLCWRSWYEVCGCNSAGDETCEELECVACECCDGPLVSATMEVAVTSSFALCPDPEIVDDIYTVPSTDGCSGELLTAAFTCSNGQRIKLYLKWEAFCDETGYYAYIQWIFYVDQFGDGTSYIPWVGDDEFQFIGEEMPVCAEIIGTATFPGSPAVTIDYTFNAA